MRNLLYILIILAFYSCQSDSDLAVSPENSDIGTGGSLNKFTIIGEELYAITRDGVQNFGIDDNGAMTEKGFTKVNREIETLFPFGNYLLVGTQTGMFIYEQSETKGLKYISDYEHVRSCDPVVASGDYAYVTLSNGNPRCATGVNELQILDISDIFNPRLVANYNLTNPLGLGIKGDLLFVCDQAGGIKVLNVMDKNNISIVDQDSGIHAVDVIAVNNIILVTTLTDLVQYSYNEQGEITRLSNIRI